MGWAGYGPESNVIASSDGGPGEPSPQPELADLARLGRRAVRGLVRAARADQQPPLTRLLRAHLGEALADLTVVQESWRAYDHVNVQMGLDAWLAEAGRRHELVGLANFRHREFGLADLIGPADPPEPWGPRSGNVSTTNQACGPDGAVRQCVVCGMYLVTEGGRRTAVLLRGAEPDGMHRGVSLQIASSEPGAAAEIAARIRELAIVHNVFRGQLLSFGGEMFEPGQTLLQFHRRPDLDRAQVILPAHALELVERQVVGVGRRKQRLVASGQHLKRGLLLYGPPGTGKTHTVRYLLSQLTDTTVLQLTGGALHLIHEACSVARTLQPAMVVVEDVDLIAEDRGMRPGAHPLLFELLNQLDGLAEDADVVFVLTTNRADLLEPALAARPGRVDQAVELELPDADARRKLIDLYRGRLILDPDGLDEVVTRTEGVTASFLKELLRRAAVIAAEADGTPDEGGAGPLAVSAAQLQAALEELLETRNAMTRVVLGSSARWREGASGDLEPGERY